MASIEIEYIFRTGTEQSSRFTLQLDAQSLDAIDTDSAPAPDWTALEYTQCPHCPLHSEQVAHCPVALSLSRVIERFNELVSYDRIELEVITEGRTLRHSTTAQKSISSLLGLMFATSGCPHTNFFKPMARFHLPLSTPLETVFRATGMYLLAQYFAAQQGKQADLELDGLREIYSNLSILNHSIAKRIRTAARTDATKNAIVILDMLASVMPMLIDEQLEGIRHLFDSYLQGLE